MGGGARGGHREKKRGEGGEAEKLRRDGVGGGVGRAVEAEVYLLTAILHKGPSALVVRVGILRNDIKHARVKGQQPLAAVLDYPGHFCGLEETVDVVPPHVDLWKANKIFRSQKRRRVEYEHCV